MNDLKAAELVSKSLSSVLTSREQSELERYLSNAPEAESFAILSSLIQKSVLAINHQIVADVDSSYCEPSERLSAIAKERMQRAIRDALSASPAASRNSQLQVAQSTTTYYRSSTAELHAESRQTVARFTLIRKIGESGLGTVWLARDETLKRDVALRELSNAGGASQESWFRFVREAEITGHLEHPNVVPLYVSGLNPETGLPFYAMRFLGKQTLADAIKEYHVRRPSDGDDPLQLYRLLNAFLDVCQAIAFAHSRGVIHCDLKPENVALDDFGQVLVLDWGLAKLDADGELARRLALGSGQELDSCSQSLDGAVAGTSLYMAPEQATGDVSQLDQRTDVYGLGAILFAILTGKAPHENSHRSGRGKLRGKETLDRIANSDTPKARDINPAVCRDLESICLRALSKQRDARHASAHELSSEIERWMAGRHRLQARYDSLRLTGQDLKSRLCTHIRQLAVTAQFMVELPPIQGLLPKLHSEPNGFNSWRERLSTILLALAKTNSNLCGLSYAQITDQRINELVRVERSLRDASSVRALPQSRLRRGAANTFHKTIMEQFPGECCFDFDFATAGGVRIVAGAPVFDRQSEEPFGLVLVEAEIGNLIQAEIAATETKHTICLIDDKDRLLFSTKQISEDSLQLAPTDISPWLEVSRLIDESAEYIEPDRKYYALRLDLPQRNNSIRIVLKIAE